MYLFVNFFCKINSYWLTTHSASYNRARLNYIWEQSIHYRSLFAMFTPLHSSTNQELFEKHVRDQSSHCEKYDSAAHAPVIVWNWSIHCPSLSAMFDLLHSSTNQEVFEKHLCIKSSHYEKYGRFLVTQRKPSARATTKLTLFTVSKDEWNTKEDTGKPLKNALHVQRYAKRHLSGWSDVEQWKNQASSLRRYRVRLVWRHQSGSQSVSHKNKFF